MSTRLRTCAGVAFLAVVACGSPAPVADDGPGPETLAEVEVEVDPIEEEPPRPEVEVDPLRQDDRETRALYRAFYTAPPVIPHEGASGMLNAACLTCHDQTGMLSPHPQFTNCTQCHVAAEAPFGELAETVENSFKGLASPHSVATAADELPPLIPHRLAMRERCIACHDPDGMYESLITPHPERVSCRQCHVPMAGVEFTR